MYLMWQFTLMGVRTINKDHLVMTISECFCPTVADPGGAQRPGPPAPVKTSHKKMATTVGHKFSKSSGPPWTNFWICYCPNQSVQKIIHLHS